MMSWYSSSRSSFTIGSGYHSIVVVVVVVVACCKSECCMNARTDVSSCVSVCTISYTLEGLSDESQHCSPFSCRSHGLLSQCAASLLHTTQISNFPSLTAGSDPSSCCPSCIFFFFPFPPNSASHRVCCVSVWAAGVVVQPLKNTRTQTQPRTSWV